MGRCSNFCFRLRHRRARRGGGVETRQVTITVKRAAGTEAKVFVHVRDAPGALQPSLWGAEGKALLARLADSTRLGDRASVKDLDRDTLTAGRQDLAGLEIGLSDVATRDAFEAYLAGITVAADRVSVWCYEAKATRFLKLFGVAANATAFTVNLAEGGG